MKPLIVTLFTVLVINTGLFAQKNAAINSDDWKCSSYKETPLYNQKSLPWYDQYDLLFAFIDVSVTDTSNDISGNVLYHAKAGSTILDTMNFQLIADLTIDSVLVDNDVVPFTRLNEVVTLDFSTALNPGQLFTWQVYYHGKPVNPTNYRGLYHVLDDVYGMNVTYSLSESFHLKEWLPCKEDVMDKLDSVWTFITVDTSLKAGSNGLLTQVTAVAPGKNRYEWKTRYPMAYYLISVNVADYSEYNLYAHPAGITDSILVQNYLYDHPNALPTVQNDLDRTPGMIELYSDLFGLYPYWQEKYGHCQVKLNGAMEHQTMTTIGPFLDWVIAHELAHQWFGDYVTCANWQDIWVNEGWATYSEFLFYEGTHDNTRMTTWVSETYRNAKLEPNGSVYVPFADVNNEGRIFSYHLSYKKGGAINRMLRYYIDNDSLFFAALKQYFILYGDSNATGEDMKNVMENVTGLSLSNYFDQWYYGQGFPIYDVAWQNIPGTPNTVDISLSVTGTSPNTPFFSVPVQMKLNLSNGTDSIVKLTPTSGSNSFSIQTGSLYCQSVVFDPGDYICDSLRTMNQGSPELAYSQLNVYFDEKENFIDVNVAHSYLLPLTLTLYSTEGKAVKTFEISQNNSRHTISDL
ncbi:MAG: hypothetical protein CVU05_13785, partial [Bacteroidetes bacterium HGW-Bacteroidetes-21]